MVKFLYLLTLFASTLIVGFLIWRGTKRKLDAEGLVFRWFLVAAGIWALGKMMQVLSPSLELQLFWNKLQYLGVTTLPVFWFLYCGLYTEAIHALRRRYISLFAVPALTCLLLLTNGFHNLIWTNSTLEFVENFPIHKSDYGAWFYLVHLPYNYLLVLGSFALLVRGLVRTERANQVPLQILTLATLLPVISNLAYLTGLTPGYLDLTPVAFSLSGVVIVLGATRFGLVRHLPLAYNQVFGKLQAPTFMLNTSLRIIELNDSAARFFETPPHKLLERSLLELFPFDKAFWLELARKPEAAEVSFRDKALSLELEPIKRAGKTQALVLHLNDVSKQQEAASQLSLELDKIKAVVETSDALMSLNSHKEVYQKTLQMVFQFTSVEFCNLLFLSPDGSELCVVASRKIGQDEDYAVGETLQLGEGLSWHVVEQAQTVRLYDKAGLTAAKLPEGFQPHSYLGVPLEDEDDVVVGVLGASISKPQSSLEDADVAFLEAIALAASSALVRIDLLEEAKRKASEYRDLYTEAERQAQELSLLDRVRTAVTRELDLSEVIRATVAAITDILGYSLVSLYLLDDMGEWLELQHQQGYSTIPERIPTSEGVMGRVARTGQAILLADPVARPELHGTLADVTSEVAVPIFDHAKVAGVLNIETTTERKLDQVDLQLMMNLSEQVSVAVERARLYGEMQANEQRLSLVANNMTDLICLHRADGTTAYVTPSSESLLGFSAEELLNTSLPSLIHPQDLPHLEQTVFMRLGAGEQVRPFTFRVRQKTGEYIWIESFVQMIADDNGDVRHFLSASRDVTERKYMQEQMIEGALLYDALTNLPNRSLFMDRLQQAIKAAEQELEPFAVLFLDLDRFKVINDSLGHSAGDALLIEASRRLQANVRAHDTVARLGGDEFAILLESTREAGATELAERLQSDLAKPFLLDGHTVFSSASIGITLYEESPEDSSHEDISDPEQLLRNADLAMYHAKASGKARYALFDRAMHQRMTELMSLESELRQAVEQNALSVVYQPIIDLDSGNLSGFEALVRWHHQERGMVSPAVFIPIAEEMGIISEIDTFVLRAACQQLSEWHRHFPSTHKLTMSTNLSTKNFILSDLVERIGKVLAETELEPKCLKLEITESVLVENAEVGANLLRDLRAKGVALQIDDFGTGYSSLSYLHTLPLDSLKIDRSFVSNLNHHDDSIIKTIITLARALNLDVVAEGIETFEQLEQLMALGCDYAQGYFFAKPLPAAALEAKYFQDINVKHTIPDSSVLDSVIN